MDNLEFFTFNNEVWFRRGTASQKLTEADTDVINLLAERIYADYPEAFKSLEKEYAPIVSPSYKRYRMVVRFCKCNFGNIDNVDDVMATGKMNFEYVSCPLRGECRYDGKICCPKFNTKMSPSEERVAIRLVDGNTEDEIADALCLSPCTVHNHVRNIYAKLGVHNRAEFTNYCNKHNLFKS